jgi:hypothetical protein
LYGNILCAQVHIPKAIVWYSIVEAEDHHLRIRRTENSKTGGTWTTSLCWKNITKEASKVRGVLTVKN